LIKSFPPEGEVSATKSQIVHIDQPFSYEEHRQLENGKPEKSKEGDMLLVVNSGS
jgi:hypothetical protein